LIYIDISIDRFTRPSNIYKYHFPKSTRNIYHFSVLFQISLLHIPISIVSLSLSLPLSNNLLKASPVSVTIPWSIRLPRVTSRKTEQKGETGKGVNRSSSFRAARLAKRDVPGFVPFRISKTIRHPQGAVAATRPKRVDGGFTVQLPPRGSGWILGGLQ